MTIISSLIMETKSLLYTVLTCFVIFHQNPLAMDLVLNLPNDGIRLVFDPVSQRLKVIVDSHHQRTHFVYFPLIFLS